jgi:hypothetical protein
MLALRILAGVAGTTALVVLGLAMSGVRVHALPRPEVVPTGPLQPMPGSTASHEVVSLDGEPTRVSRCYAASLDPETVLAHYEELAGDDTRPRKIPYLLQEDPAGGGVLAWVAPDGSRRTAFVAKDTRGGTSYRLLEAGAPTDPDASHDRVLPGGVDVPGADVCMSVVTADGGGLCLLDLPCSADQAVSRLRSALASRGLLVDAELASALADARPDDCPRTVPLRDASGASRGLLVVTPAGGTTRVSLSVRAPS